MAVCDGSPTKSTYYKVHALYYVVSSKKKIGHYRPAGKDADKDANKRTLMDRKKTKCCPNAPRCRLLLSRQQKSWKEHYYGLSDCETKAAIKVRFGGGGALNSESGGGMAAKISLSEPHIVKGYL